MLKACLQTQCDITAMSVAPPVSHSSHPHVSRAFSADQSLSNCLAMKLLDCSSEVEARHVLRLRDKKDGTAEAIPYEPLREPRSSWVPDSGHEALNTGALHRLMYPAFSNRKPMSIDSPRHRLGMLVTSISPSTVRGVLRLAL